MSEPIEITAKKELYFTTLKLSGDLRKTSNSFELFEKREICDEFIKSLIFSIEHYNLQLYGFVILSDQIHLIANTWDGDLTEKIEKLKQKSARDIILVLSKIMSSNDHVKTRGEQYVRRILSQLLNSGGSSLWQSEEIFIELVTKNMDDQLHPISSEMLHSHLGSSNREYLQIGANAFTRLMLDSMKI